MILNVNLLKLSHSSSKFYGFKNGFSFPAPLFWEISSDLTSSLLISFCLYQVCWLAHQKHSSFLSHCFWFLLFPLIVLRVYISLLTLSICCVFSFFSLDPIIYQSCLLSSLSGNPNICVISESVFVFFFSACCLFRWNILTF